jgi:hypothetical protein
LQFLLVVVAKSDCKKTNQFRAAIDSMSPEQQRFASAFRSMQLEGSMFALVVVDIKPQVYCNQSVFSPRHLIDCIVGTIVEFAVWCVDARDQVDATAVRNVCQIPSEHFAVTFASLLTVMLDSGRFVVV